MAKVLRYRRAERIAARTIDGVAYVVSVDQQRMVELNEVGTFLWEELQSPATLDGLVDRLCTEFEVERTAARPDVEAFLGDLVARGVLDSEAEIEP